MKQILVFIFLISVQSALAQKNSTTIGIQVKPIFPFNFLGTGKVTNDQNGIHFENELSSGFSGGLIIRHAFTDLIGIESGINYVKRKYSLAITDGSFTGKSGFTIIGYEIPVSFVIYAQVTEKSYINGSLGPSADMFASSVQTFDYYFNHVSIRNHIIMPAVNANVGYEYRTEKNGTLYIGASYHRPFRFIYEDRVKYANNNKEEVIDNLLVGNYLTIDFRYFFPADPSGKTKPRMDE